MKEIKENFFSASMNAVMYLNPLRFTSQVKKSKKCYNRSFEC